MDLLCHCAGLRAWSALVDRPDRVGRRNYLGVTDMIALWLVAPIAAVIVFYLLLRVESSEFNEAARRERAIKRLEETSGRGLPNDEDRSAGWVVDPDGNWPRRVRLFRPERSAGSVSFEEAEAEEAISGGGTS